MKLVVDSNVLFTFFWRKSVSRDLFLHQDLDLFAPEFALDEIKKYSKEIQRKAKLTKGEFSETMDELCFLVEFIPLGNYSHEITKALRICPDSDDVDFLALAQQLQCPIWSNDRALQAMKYPVFPTKEIIELFD